MFQSTSIGGRNRLAVMIQSHRARKTSPDRSTGPAKSTRSFDTGYRFRHPAPADRQRGKASVSTGSSNRPRKWREAKENMGKIGEMGSAVDRIDSTGTRGPYKPSATLTSCSAPTMWIEQGESGKLAATREHDERPEIGIERFTANRHRR